MKLLKSFIIPGICLVVILILFQYVFLLGYVPSTSMEPTLEKGSLIFGLRWYGELETGDIIVFEHDDTLMVKRIAGLPGEVVRLGDVFYHLPEDGYLVLGDNEENSYDSRYWDEPYVYEDDIKAVLLTK